jgi:phosphatidylglycerol:prolipoprotein diacylglycerol transferase
MGTPLHPTQLYESIADFAIFGLLYRRIRKPHATGSVIAIYLMLYPAVRFVVEFFRFHEQGNLWGGPLDTSQWISLALLGASAVWFIRNRRKPVRKPQSARVV